MGGPCGSHRERKNEYKVKETRSLGRPRCTWKDTNQMDLKEMGRGTVGWINLAQDRNILLVLMNRRCSFEFHERETAWLAEKLSASQAAPY